MNGRRYGAGPTIGPLLAVALLFLLAAIPAMGASRSTKPPVKPSAPAQAPAASPAQPAPSEIQGPPPPPPAAPSPPSAPAAASPSQGIPSTSPEIQGPPTPTHDPSVETPAPATPMIEAELESIAAPSGEEPSRWRRWIEEAGIGGHGRFDYYSASKRLDNNHSLPGFTLQPKAMPKFGSWGDAKIEGRFTDQDVSSGREPRQGRLLEAYTNLYFGSVDVRIGKQIIPWGRADALNPTDNLTPKDFTVLSARDEEDRRTGTFGIKTNYYSGPYTLSLIWLPLFNPNTIPIARPPGFLITEEKRNSGAGPDQGFAIKLDRTAGDLDWSVSYYQGLDVFPVGRPVTTTEAVLIHNRLNVIGADFAKPIGRYGLRGEAAYVQTQNFSGTDPIIKFPFFYYVLGIDRDITDDLNINIQAYQRLIINWHDRFQIQDPLLRNIATLNVIFNQQQDRYQEGLTGRLKATWFNKTLEGELLGVFNANRTDFFLRPSLTYAFTDVWKGYIGWDIFNGRRESFFGRLEPTTSFFVELRATL